MKYQLDEDSLQRLGVPKKFELLPWSTDIYKGEDGGIYVLTGNKMHLLTKNASAYPVSLGINELPKAMMEIKSKLNAFAVEEKRMQKANEFIKKLQSESEGVNFAFVIESKDKTHRQEVFAKGPYGYKKLPEPFFIGGAAKALITLGRLLIFRENKYEITDFIPIFQNYFEIAFWGGEKEIFSLGTLFYMQFERIGCIENLIQTEVSTLLKIKEDNKKISFFHLSAGRKCVFSRCLKAKEKCEFKVNENTGDIHLTHITPKYNYYYCLEFCDDVYKQYYLTYKMK